MGQPEEAANNAAHAPPSPSRNVHPRHARCGTQGNRSDDERQALMPPLVFLDLPPSGAVAPRVPICELMRHDRVEYEQRVYIVRGFDPIGVVEPLVYLEDAGTGERTVAPLIDLLESGRQHSVRAVGAGQAPTETDST